MFGFVSWLELDRQDVSGLPELGSRRAQCGLSPRGLGRGELCGDVR